MLQMTLVFSARWLHSSETRVNTMLRFESCKKLLPEAPDAFRSLHTHINLPENEKKLRKHIRAPPTGLLVMRIATKRRPSRREFGQFDRATKFLKRAEAIEPNNYRLHAIRGQIASLEDRNDEAIREYRFAVDHLPPAVQEGPLYPVSLHLSLYEMYQRTNQAGPGDAELNAARTALSGITGLETSPEFLRLRALIEADSNDPVSAEKDLKAGACD